jgi:hypothetical protein
MNIAFADTDHETEIGLDHLLAGLLVAGHHSFAKLLFLFKGQQRGPPDFPEITLQGIQPFRAAP